MRTLNTQGLVHLKVLDEIILDPEEVFWCHQHETPKGFTPNCKLNVPALIFLIFLLYSSQKQNLYNVKPLNTVNSLIESSIQQICFVQK
jgi:hypothetical protein